jgi:hypothetical protein
MQAESSAVRCVIRQAWHSQPSCDVLRMRRRSASLRDRQPIRVDYPRKELINRILADVCALCQHTGEDPVHHVRKLADLDKSGMQRKGHRRVSSPGLSLQDGV